MSTTDDTPIFPPRRSGARVHLPQLTADEALLLVAILEKLIAAIHRTHGDAMADRIAAAGIETPRPEGARWVCECDDDFDDDF